MEIQSILNNAVISRLMTAQAAGTGDVLNSLAVDLAGAESALFLIELGSIAAGGIATVQLQGSEDNGVSDPFVNLYGTKIANAGNASGGNMLAIEARAIQSKRFVRVTITRTGGANVGIDSVIAEVFALKNLVAAQGATIDGSLQVVGLLPA
jgi:hypothetical protein